MIRCLIIVEGRVQGVGFRYFAQSNAIKYALTGFARNLNNGMVEIQVQGLEENIAKFLSIINIHFYFYYLLLGDIIILW